MPEHSSLMAWLLVSQMKRQSLAFTARAEGKFSLAAALLPSAKPLSAGPPARVPTDALAGLEKFRTLMAWCPESARK
jgi:hypothetical protein